MAAKEPDKEVSSVAKISSDVVHYEDFADECDGPPSWHVTSAKTLVTCQDCLRRLVAAFVREE
jgi:hypothetical protein